jgi:hypothetical protein
MIYTRPSFKEKEKREFSNGIDVSLLSYVLSTVRITNTPLIQNVDVI